MPKNSTEIATVEFETGGPDSYSWLTITCGSRFHFSKDEAEDILDFLKENLKPSDETLEGRVNLLEERVGQLESVVVAPDSEAIAAATASQTPAEVIAEAIKQGFDVVFQYQGEEDLTPRDREMTPAILDTEAEHPYVQGEDFDARDVRRFRLDRIVGEVELS